MVILVPETTRLLMSTGSFTSPVWNGFKKTWIRTILARASSTAAGTATRSARTIRLWRAAAAKRASIPVT